MYYSYQDQKTPADVYSTVNFEMTNKSKIVATTG